MTKSTLSENSHFVTTHRYRTSHKLGILLVTLGWNNTNRGFFLTIHKDEEEEGGLLWSHQNQQKPYPKSLGSFLEVLEGFEIMVPQDMITQVKKDRKGIRSKITWHLDAPYSPQHTMTHHYFHTAHEGVLTHVHMGWNNSLEGFYLIIEKDGYAKGPFWSNLDRQDKQFHYPQTLDLFVIVLEKLRITLPPEMIEEVLSDKGRNKNKLVFHHVGSGEYTRCLVWE